MLIQEWYKSQLHVDSIERSAASTGPFNSAAEIPPRKLSSNELWDDNSILPLEARASFETRQDRELDSSHYHQYSIIIETLGIPLHRPLF